MTIDDRYGSPSGTARSPEYDDGLTVQDTTHSASPVGLPGAGRVASASDTLGGVGATAGIPGGASRDLGDNHDGLGRDRTDALTADESGTLISSDKVVGTAVYDASGERLGTIDSIMLNKRSGKVAYAVMSFGGFLGIGERYHPLPWHVLTYDEAKGGYNIEHSADDLREAPNYSRGEVDSFDYGREGGVIDSYYGVDVGRNMVSDQGDSPYRGGSVDTVRDEEPTAGNTTRPYASTGIESADAIGSTTGAGSSGLGSTGMGSNRNF